MKKNDRPYTTPYEDFLYPQLRDLEFASGYLNQCLKDEKAVFMIALRDVVEANGGIGSLAKTTKLNREGLYKMLSRNGNPTANSLKVILESLGIEMQFAARQSKPRAKKKAAARKRKAR